MPAKNPRLTITLDPITAAQMRRISELTGNSQSALISELLTDSRPVFSRLITVLEAAKQAKAEVRTSMASDLANAQTKMESQLGLALDTFDEYTGDLLEGMEEVVRRKARRGARALAPSPARAVPTPISNRGVRSHAKTSNPPVKRGKK